MPSSIPAHAIQSVIDRALSGDKKAREELILSHINLSLSIVGRYLTVLGTSDLSEDLSSVAVQSVTDTVEKLIAGEIKLNDSGITKVIVQRVHNAISKYLDHLPLIRVPAITQRKRKVRGLEYLPQPQRVDSDLLNGGPAEYDIVHQNCRRLKVRENQKSEIDVDAILNKVIVSDLERAIFNLRLSSINRPLSDKEIAKRLGVTQRQVFYARNKIRERFEKEIKDDI